MREARSNRAFDPGTGWILQWRIFLGNSYLTKNVLRGCKTPGEQPATRCHSAVWPGGISQRGPSLASTRRWFRPIGSALPSWKVAFETSSISLKSSQGKVPVVPFPRPGLPHRPLPP